MVPKNPLCGIPTTGGINIFTDGSKDKLKSGAGVVVTIGNKTITDSEGNEMKYHYHLADRSTIHQCELFAIKMAATLIIHGSVEPGNWVDKSQPITIHSDCQAAILALNSVWIKSKLVKETIDLLDRASECCADLTIRYVKAHVGISGNDLADEEARRGRDADIPPDW